MKEHPDDKKARFDVKDVVGGWKLNVWFWGFNTIHVMATKGKPRGPRSWNLNLIFKLVDGKWVEEKFRDRWVIRYDAQWPKQDPSCWKKTYSPRGTKALVERMRKTCIAIANMKEAARWRAEGFLRSRDRRRALERYFEGRKNLDMANKRATRTQKEYREALALEKAFSGYFDQSPEFRGEPKRKNLTVVPRSR